MLKSTKKTSSSNKIDGLVYPRKIDNQE